MYSYKSYGLIFASEFEIPELKPVDGVPDVVIRIGVVPRNQNHNADEKQSFQATSKEFLLWQKDIADFYVQNGSEITLEPHMEDIHAPEIRLLLLGSVFGALLQQRGFLVLHGACVAIKGKGILLTGVSGAGKSTLAAFLHKKGYAVLTDDVCAVTIGTDGRPYINPGFPNLKLWQDSAEKLGASIGGLEPVMQSRKKYRIGIQHYYGSDHIAFNEIYVLDVHDEDTIKIEPVSGIDTLDTLIKNTYRYCFLQEQGLKSRHFKMCTSVAGKISVYHIWRPKEGFMIDELAEAVEKNVCNSIC